MIKFIKRLFIMIILLIISVMALFTYNGYKLYEQAINEMSIVDKINEIKKETKNYTKYEELPKDYINAIVAVEDKRYYLHKGVDPISISRAIITDIKTMSFAEGGSTITQQLAKNTYFTQKKEITRKVAEVFMAIEFEKECSKEEILELYVNTMYFGDGYYNVHDACKGYFDKEVSQMNRYESTLLAGIPNAPSVYAPTKNPELAKQRQVQVLNKMVDAGYLTTEEANEVKENNKNN